MARREQSPRPTDAELAILRVLWKLGPATVREVHEALQNEQSTGYTTVLKTMQIMIGKRLLDRDDSERSHVYRARQTADETRGRLVGDLMERAFEGSAARLAMRALATQRASKQELAELRRLLKRMEEEGA